VKPGTGNAHPQPGVQVLALPLGLAEQPEKVAYACAICGRLDSDGTHGPPGLLPDDEGNACSIRMCDVWLCSTCSARKWREYFALAPKVRRRRALLARWRAGDPAPRMGAAWKVAA
jgi:hypothetical protein